MLTTSNGKTFSSLEELKAYNDSLELEILTIKKNRNKELEKQINELNQQNQLNVIELKRLSIALGLDKIRERREKEKLEKQLSDHDYEMDSLKSRIQDAEDERDEAERIANYTNACNTIICGAVLYKAFRR